MSKVKIALDFVADGIASGDATVTATLVDSAGTSVSSPPVTVIVSPEPGAPVASLTVISSS